MSTKRGQMLVLIMWMFLFPYQKVSAVARQIFSPTKEKPRTTENFILSQGAGSPEILTVDHRSHYSHRSHGSHWSHTSHRSSTPNWW